MLHDDSGVCGDVLGRRGEGPEVATQTRQCQVSRSPKVCRAALTPLLALAWADTTLDSAGFPITLVLVPQDPDANVIRSARPSLLRTAGSEKHPIASLRGQLLAPPSSDSLNALHQASTLLPTSSLHRFNGKACRQGVFPSTGS